MAHDKRSDLISLILSASKARLEAVAICLYHIVRTSDLQSTSFLQQIWHLALLRLQVAVATNVLLTDEDVWHRALVRHLLERILDR